MKRSISELEFKVESIKLELKLAKSELKNAKRLEKLRKRQQGVRKMKTLMTQNFINNYLNEYRSIQSWRYVY